MSKASSTKPSAEDNNMSLLDHCRFYERKTRHLQKYFLCEHRKVQGIFALVCQAPKKRSNTQYTRKRVRWWSPSPTQHLMWIPNKATEQAYFIALAKSLSYSDADSNPKRRHCDSRTQLSIYLCCLFVVIMPQLLIHPKFPRFTIFKKRKENERKRLSMF